MHTEKKKKVNFDHRSSAMQIIMIICISKNIEENFKKAKLYVVSELV